MPRLNLSVNIDGDKIYAKSDVPVKGLIFYVEDVDAVEFDDNFLDLVPGDQQIMIANSLNGRAVN
jgi:beta-mannosidase